MSWLKAERWQQGRRICFLLKAQHMRESSAKFPSAIPVPPQTDSPLLSVMILCLWVECSGGMITDMRDDIRD